MRVVPYLAIALLVGCSAASPTRVVEEKRWPRTRTLSQQSVQPAATAEALVSGAAGESEPTEYFRSEPTGTGERQDWRGHAHGISAENAAVQLNFQNADIRGVVDAVLGDMLKLNYTVDPAIQGQIALSTRKPVAREALISVLEAALLSVSAALVEQNGMYQIVPLDMAPQRVKGARIYARGTEHLPGYAVEVIPLKYVSAGEMQKVLLSFIPKAAILQADDAHNHLVIAGTGPDRAGIVRTIESFDRDWLKGMTFAMYRLEHVGPERLIAELNQVFQPPLEIVNNRVRLVPIERLRSILGAARNPTDLELVEGWVRRLDVAPKTGERRLFVYNVNNGNAKALAASLQLVMTGERLSTEEEESASTSYEAAPGSGVSDAKVSSPASTDQNHTRIVANEENNSLLIYATEQEYQAMQETLRQLDTLPRQVMIEAVLAEVTLTDDLRYGVQWFFDNGNNSITLSAVDTGGVVSEFPGFSYIYSGSADVRVVLNALQSHTNVDVLSAPKLAVVNKQKATLQVGDQVPIVTQSTQGVISPGAPIVNSIQMRDTGVILEVMPIINENGNIILDVTQEVSDVTQTTTSGIDSPTIQRRRLRSVVATQDGATVALGGLIRENGSRAKSGVPLLKDIPLVGALFSDNTSSARRTELLVLIVPHVMRNHAETQAVVDALVGQMESASAAAGRARPIELPSRPASAQ